jgi:hypothetical protein
MITGLRSILACEEVVETEDGRVNYLGVASDRLHADSRPGFVSVWLAIVCDLDGQRTEARLELTAPDFNHAFPFQAPAGITATGLLVPVLIPILNEGQLTVRVIDEGKGGKVLKARFDLLFHADAKVLDDHAGRRFVEEANLAAETMKAGLTTTQRH